MMGTSVADAGSHQEPAAPAGPTTLAPVVYITGAGTGIGLACAQRFADRGARVVGCGLGAARPERFPLSADWLECDVTDEEQQAAVVRVAAGATVTGIRMRQIMRHMSP